MLDIKLIRQDATQVNAALARRNDALNINALLELDESRLALLTQEETLRSQRNGLNKQLADLKKAGAAQDAVQAVIDATRDISAQIKTLESQKDALDAQQHAILLALPNLPHPQTPQGKTEADNVELKRWGDEFKTRVPENALPHWDIGTQNGWLDFERGVKVSKSRFTTLRAEGAKLSRVLIQFMLETHLNHGDYEEVAPPFLVNRAAMTGTSQLPKFEADMFATQDDLFLTPTAEVPVTNLYADEILDASQLPLRFVAHTPCFRREAGSAGQDTRGLIRQHQFDKVELVKITTPEQADAEYARLIEDAERILQLLELPYRVVQLCAGDLGFAAARCVDLEVWMPAQGVYREISSCSHFDVFQARRANLKYRPHAEAKAELLHTINGSGLAVGRTLAAILENYQTADGRVAIPAALKPYFKQQTHLTPQQTAAGASATSAITAAAHATAGPAR
ncbi:MAG: serine--tRNA ligase [Vampirovibrionales bacterium]|nr:serine--tRNA ligase [Vampirovibrionales bacterium]